MILKLKFRIKFEKEDVKFDFVVSIQKYFMKCGC